MPEHILPQTSDFSEQENEAPEGASMAPPKQLFADDGTPEIPPTGESGGATGLPPGSGKPGNHALQRMANSSGSGSNSRSKTLAAPPLQLQASPGFEQQPSPSGSAEAETAVPTASQEGESETPVHMPDEIIQLGGGSFNPSQAMANYLDSSAAKGGAVVRVALGEVASGSIKVKKQGDGYTTTGAQDCALAVNNSFAGLVAGAGAQLVAVIEINGQTVSGYNTVKVGGVVVPFGDLVSWISENASNFGFAGFDNFGGGFSITNEINGGQLRFSIDMLPVKIGGWVNAHLSFGYLDAALTFTAQGNVEVPHLANAELILGMDSEKKIVGQASADVTMGNFSGAVNISYNQGTIDAAGKARYEHEKLSGEVNLLVTDANTARTVALNQLNPEQVNDNVVQDQQIGMQEGAELGPRALAGWGELDFAFNDWLTGKAKVMVDNEGHVTVQGAITPPAEVEIFPQKDWVKELPRLEARAIYGIPVVGNVFVFANIGLDLLAKIGPAKLYDMELAGTYSTDPAINSDISLAASLNMSAFAGARLRAEGGAGLEIADHDIKAGLGVEATAGVRGYIDARPQIGFRETAGDGTGEFYIKGHMEMAGQPFLGLSGDFFVELDSPWWSPAPDKTWDWPIGSLEYPLPGGLGIGADFDYVLGSGEMPEIQFGEVDFSADKFMTDMVNDHVPDDGAREVEAEGTFADGITTEAGEGGEVVDQSGGDGIAAQANSSGEGPAPGLEEQRKQALEQEGKDGPNHVKKEEREKEEVGKDAKVQLPKELSQRFSMDGEGHTLFLVLEPEARVDMASSRANITARIEDAKKKLKAEGSGNQDQIEDLDKIDQTSKLLLQDLRAELESVTNEESQEFNEVPTLKDDFPRVWDLIRQIEGYASKYDANDFDDVLNSIPLADQLDRLIYEALDSLAGDTYQGGTRDSIAASKSALEEDTTKDNMGGLGRQKLLENQMLAKMKEEDIEKAAAEERNGIAKLQVQLSALQRAYKRAAMANMEGNNEFTVFGDETYTFSVDQVANYIFPRKYLLEYETDANGKILAHVDGGRFDFRYTNPHHHLSIRNTRSILNAIRDQNPSDVSSIEDLNMILAAFVAEPHRYPVAHVSHLLVVGNKSINENESVWNHLTMTRGGATQGLDNVQELPEGSENLISVDPRLSPRQQEKEFTQLDLQAVRKNPALMTSLKGHLEEYHGKQPIIGTVKKTLVSLFKSEIKSHLYT